MLVLIITSAFWDEKGNIGIGWKNMNHEGMWWIFSTHRLTAERIQEIKLKEQKNINNQIKLKVPLGLGSIKHRTHINTPLGTQNTHSNSSILSHTDGDIKTIFSVLKHFPDLQSLCFKWRCLHPTNLRTDRKGLMFLNFRTKLCVSLPGKSSEGIFSDRNNNFIYGLLLMFSSCLFLSLQIPRWSDGRRLLQTIQLSSNHIETIWTERLVSR